jgi:hypothetical protein
VRLFGNFIFAGISLEKKRNMRYSFSVLANHTLLVAQNLKEGLEAGDGKKFGDREKGSLPLVTH